MMDPKELDGLAKVLRDNGLTRLRLEEDGRVVELECAPAPVQVVAASGAPAGPLPAPAPAPQAPAAPGAAAQEAEGDSPDDDSRGYDMSKVTDVTAPMVGVFYAAPSPGAEPFVHVGSKVKKGDTLCVIEAMKLMNEVVADQDGEVVDVCVSDGELVEYGCTLMKLL